MILDVASANGGGGEDGGGAGRRGELLGELERVNDCLAAWQEYAENLELPSASATMSADRLRPGPSAAGAASSSSTRWPGSTPHARGSGLPAPGRVRVAARARQHMRRRGSRPLWAEFAR